jgi:hypothetical protein
MRNEQSCCGLAEVRNVEERELRDARVNRGNARNFGNLIDQRFFGARFTTAKTSAKR